MRKPLSLIKRLTAMTALATLVACGGGGGGGGTPPAPATAKLSGTVQTGSLAAGAGKLSKGMLTGISVDETSFTTGTNLANAIVIAVNQQGETFTDSADASGAFVLDALPAGEKFALIFIDPRTMNVIASLVQASNTDITGAVAPSGDTNLGFIVIDPALGAAVAQADAFSNVTVENADSMDANGDGIVTGDDINTLQANTLTSSGSTTSLENISLINFLGDANTWHVNRYYENDPANNYFWDERNFVVNREARVTGPNGTLINVIKQGEVPYYSYDGTLGDGWDDGYWEWSSYWLDYDYASLTNLASPPVSYWDSYVYGWADYR